MNDNIILPEDYNEPCCLLKMSTAPDPVPVKRILERLDEYLSRKNYEAGIKHLDYWLNEAKQINDVGGMFTVLNEQIGIYRKTNNKDKCFEAIKGVIKLSKLPDFKNTVTLGTAYINIATGYKAFDETLTALTYYEKSKEIYEKYLNDNDARLGGLYNNMALTLTSLNKFDEAEEMFNKAISIMLSQPDGEPEAAITYINLADLAVAKYGVENSENTVRGFLDKAEKLLFKEGLKQDVNYAFVCEKCADVFGYYGYFLTKAELKDRAKKIYERS